MRKNKKQGELPPSQHNRTKSKPKLRPSRNSHPRLSLNPSPPKFQGKTFSKNFLSNPSSLQKKKPKLLHKKTVKAKRKVLHPTQQTVESTCDGRWKEHLKLTFRSKHQSNEISLHNSSLKCMEGLYELSQRKPAQSYSSLVKTFPQEELSLSLLGSRERIFLLDWLSYVASELLCRRNTYHLAVAFIDGYLDKSGVLPAKLQALGAGALLLSVKQEQRGNQTYVLNVLCGSGSGLTREQILSSESIIITSLGFKLNFNTLSFWCDYFSQKWDAFIRKECQRSCRDIQYVQDKLILLRNPQGISYRYYREMMQLADAMIINGGHRKFDFSELALSVLYLVVRVQSEARASEEDVGLVFEQYYQGFQRKASPIFNDKFNFNAIFNEFITQTCNFQISLIVPGIRWTGNFLGMVFVSEIDSRVYQSAANFQEFLRYSNYTTEIRDYFLERKESNL